MIVVSLFSGQVWPLHRRPFGKPDLATGGNSSGLEKLHIAWPFRVYGGSWSFRASGGLPRGVAVLGDRRPSRQILTIVVVLVAKDTQLPWPEAALPCMRRVMVVPCLRRPASRCRGSWRSPAFSTELFGKPELAAVGNCSGLDKLQLAWPEAALPRYAAGHGRSVLAAACLAVSLLGDLPAFSTELSCMAHPREGVFRADRQTRRLSLCRK